MASRWVSPACTIRTRFWSLSTAFTLTPAIHALLHSHHCTSTLTFVAHKFCVDSTARPRSRLWFMSLAFRPLHVHTHACCL